MKRDRRELPGVHVWVLCACGSLLILATLLVFPALAIDDVEVPDFEVVKRELVRAHGSNVQVYRLTLDIDGLEILVQNQDEPSYVDRYRFNEGALTGPKPVRFKSQPTAKTIAYNCIPLDELRFDLLPSMVAEAKKRHSAANPPLIEIELGRVHDLGARGNVKSILWEVWVRQGEDSLTSQFDLKGHYRASI